MKKNPLEEIYSSKVLLNEEKDNVVTGSKELDSKIGKAGLIAGQGADKVKKDIEDPEEAEGTDVKAATPAVLKDSKEEPKKAFEGSFERLFKATLNEEFGEEPVVDMEVEIPTSDEEMADELNDEKDEVSDLVSDLKSVMDHLQSILDKVSDATAGEGEESSEEESEFGSEDEVEDTEEEKPMGEATELEAAPDGTKKLQGKDNKVGSVKAKSGKAHGGAGDSDPELKPAKAHDKSLQNPKGKPEVKSTVKKGEFFK